MLRADIVMSHELGFFNRVLQDLLGLGGEGYFSYYEGIAAFGQIILQLDPELFQVYTQFLQNCYGYTASVFEYSQKDVLGPEKLMLVPFCFLPG